FVMFDAPTEQIPGPAIVNGAGALTEKELAGRSTINHCPGATLGQGVSRTFLCHIVLLTCQWESLSQLRPNTYKKNCVCITKASNDHEHLLFAAIARYAMNS